jgi:hypothetical protein
MEEETQRRGKGCGAGKSAQFITRRFSFFYLFVSEVKKKTKKGESISTEQLTKT